MFLDASADSLYVLVGCGIDAPRLRSIPAGTD